MWRKLLGTGGYLVAGILVLAATASSLVRLYPSLYQHYLPVIQDNISSRVGKSVHIQSMRIDWYGYTPQIAVEGLSVYSDDTQQKPLLSAEKALISIDPLNSLIHRKLAIRELKLTGSHLEAVRTMDQRILLNGMDISERVASREKLSEVSDIRISLLESTLAIKDEVMNWDYLFDRVDIVLGFHEEKLRISSNFLLPDTLGDSLVLAAEMEDFDQGLNHIKGTLYTKGENINLELLGNFFPELQVGIRTGRSDFEVWGDFASLQERLFHGRLAFRDLEYRKTDHPVAQGGQEIIALDTQFQIQGSQDSWHLTLAASDIQTAGRKWAGRHYEMKCIHCGAETFTVAGAMEYVNVPDLLATLHHFPVFPERLRGFLPGMQIDGELSHAQVLTRWHDRHVVKYAYEASLQDMSVFAPAYQFEVSSLSGKVTGNHLQGSFVLNSPAARIHAHQLAEQAFPDQQITGRLKWKFTDRGAVAALENISLAAEGVHANLQGIVRMNRERSYIDLQAEVSKAQFAALKPWLPHKKMNPKLARWLQENVKGGVLNHTRLLFNGDPGYFPFSDHPGRLEIYAEVEEGSLDYRKNWPGVRNVAASLEIRNTQLNVHGDQGEILDSSIHGFTASIEDIRLPRLILGGRTSGPADDILGFLKQSALIPQNSQIPRHISVEGDVGLDLNLVLTLTKKLEKERHVNGILEFRDTGLTFSLASLPFTNVTGKLRFTRHGAEGEGIRARLYGSAFDADAALLENGRTRLHLKGDLDVDAWLAANPTRAAEYIQGKTPVSATIRLPQFGKHVEDKSLEINIDSDLTGVALALPEPLGKDREASSALNIHTRYQAGVAHPLFVGFENRVFVQALPGADGKRISALEVRMGDDRFDLPPQGVKVSGKFDQLNMTEWLNTLKSNTQTDSLALHEMNIQADEISVSGLTFQDASFSLGKDTQSWTGTIRSHTVSGEFQYPLAPGPDSIVTARFDHFRFNKPEEEISLSIDPRHLPALDVYIKQFELNDHPVHEVTLKTVPASQGMVIDSLVGEGDSLQIVASGVWDVDAKNNHSTDLDIVLVTQDLHDSLTGLGFDTAMNKGEGTISAKLDWPDTPYQFSLDAFSGTANLRLQDGEISSVDPGAGRLVGLFNLGEISRRLAFDFSDVFAKGHVFDKICGNLVFKDGNLTTEDLRIKGPSADIEIAGRTGIVARDYDQRITVTPHVSEGLPWLAIPMGPVGVGGVYILGKIAKKVGIHVDKAVDKVVEVEYHMTGSWDSPEIEPVAQKAASTEPSLQASPSAPSAEESPAGSP